MMSPLHEYQKTARDFVLDRLFVNGESGAGLLLDPGLGKTRITLEVLRTLFALDEVKRVLVVAPMRVCHLVWPREIKKWQVPATCRVLCGNVKRHLCRRHDVEIVNPESLHHLLDYPGRWDFLVCDESTKFKNWSAKRTKVLRKLLPTIRRRVILTGTPVANSLGDMHSQMFIVDDGERLGRNATVFRHRFMRKGGWQGKQWVFREEEAQALNDAVADAVIRMDAETHLDMPELVVNPVYCSLPAEAEREYARLKRDLLAQLETGDILALNQASAYAKCRQAANGRVYDSERQTHTFHAAKVDALEDLIDELGGKRVLVFHEFKHDVEAIKSRLKGVKVLDGSTPADQADKYVDDWNANKIKVFLVHPQAASHGLNLQGSDCADVVFYGLPSIVEAYEQAFRRVYRQGVSARQVRIHRLLTEGTVDETMSMRLDGKIKTQDEFFEALKQHARSK